MITRLGKVLGSIINKNQATFIPNQHIQDRILIAYELIKGYPTKGGDIKSISLVKEAFEVFSKYIGLSVNLNKCKYYGSNVDKQTKHDIHLTNFSEGPLPFKYLAIPLMNKMLFVYHFLSLVEKIVASVKHWSARLLSFAGTVQLIKSIIFSIANNWMQFIPSPNKFAIKLKLYVGPSFGVVNRLLLGSLLSLGPRFSPSNLKGV
ncbi:hypothetical protein KIW84_052077 [Lathyrus oleraceus]|uniref:Reverse transcriptase domain-containing protein n=1 Tax=Pisum sativum TaxID=3888 RepID=A0A9D5AEG2_PEA|nr:hypothetical protein KIW84_052077 [Pisum sativum]